MSILSERETNERPDSGWGRGPWGPGGSPGVQLGSALIWLLFIIFPLADAIGSSAPLGRHLLAIFGAIVFVVAYVMLVHRWQETHGGPVTSPLLLTLLVVASVLTIVDGAGWGFLFTYCAACAGFSRPQSLGFGMVVVSAALAAGTTLIAGGHGSGGDAIGYAASSLGIGLLLSLMSGLRDRNQQLTEARGELARLAVTAERERFARDLHDLLGQTLSVITLKAELAGRLLPARPEEAAREVADVERVARQALGEVRDAVGGYRQPTLDSELEGARMALSAAGIEPLFSRPSVALPEHVEAVLAWTVREGATNVIRHSGAHHCTVTVAAGGAGGPDAASADTAADSGAAASVEVVDDGPGRAANGDGAGGASGGVSGGGSRGGSGLVGLAARVEAVAGTLEAGVRPEGGYRLRVTVPQQ
jgi:two-component system, NarL family, sensor histidine kinase DesK